MLGLNSKRWQQLDHAYGPAGNIPDLLRDMRTVPPPPKGKYNLSICW